MKKTKLLPKRSKNKPVQFSYPLRIELAYQRALEKMIDEITRGVVKAYTQALSTYIISDSIYNSIKRAGELATYYTYTESFIRKYVNISDYFVRKLEVWTKEEAKRAYKQLFGIQKVVYSSPVETVIKKYIKNNADMITSLANSSIKKVGQFVSKEIREGTRNEELMKIIMRAGEVNKARARFIARDQTAKINGEITGLRQTEAGARFYIWRTTGDEVVRESHKVLNGKYCSWEDNTVYADTLKDALSGKWKKRENIGAFEGIPGFDFRCRCTGEMVIEDIIEKIENGEKIENIALPPQN